MRAALKKRLADEGIASSTSRNEAIRSTITRTGGKSRTVTDRKKEASRRACRSFQE